MAKVISIATVLTIGISTFGVESAWIPNIVKRIDFANSSNGSSSSEDSKPSSANPAASKPAASSTSKNPTPASQSPANFSNSTSKNVPKSSASNSAPAQSNSADPTTSGSSTSALASSAESSSATSPTSSESTVADQQSSKSTSSSGAIGAVVAMAIIIVIGAVAYLIVRRKKAKQNRVKMVEKADPFTMGYGNHDPLPYKEMNNTSMTDNTYPTNGAYTNEANAIHSTQMGFTGNPPSDSTVSYSQPLQPNSTTMGNYNTNPAPVFSQPQVSAVPAAFDGNTAPVVTPLSQNHSSNIYAVVATYIPTLSDELEIEMGDQIDLEAEFDDGWCQGKNITKGGVAGVFPRHCIDRVASTTNQPADVERTKRVSSIRIQ